LVIPGEEVHSPDNPVHIINLGGNKSVNDWWKYQEEEYRAAVEEEMKQMTNLARKAGVTCKVIFETCYLTQEEIIKAAEIASRVKPDFIKTSTGFGTAGATAKNVKLMKDNCGPDVQVKAAGGIRSWKSAKEMIEAGATRLGTSSGIKIIEELKEEVFNE